MRIIGNIGRPMGGGDPIAYCVRKVDDGIDTGQFGGADF